MISEKICINCGLPFKGGPRAYYCPGCRLERQRDQNRDFKLRKKKGEYRKLGSADKCERCGKDYVVEAGLQRFCKEFQSSTRTVTCSDECKRQHINKMYRERYRKRNKS